MFLILATLCAQLSPEPLSIDLDPDKPVELASGTFVVFADESAATNAGWFDALNDAVGGSLRRITAARYRDNEFAFYIGEANDHPAFRERRLRRLLDDLPATGSQGYRLIVDKRAVIVAGANAAGVRNGVASLMQLFGDDGTLPQTRVRDEPELEIRAIRLPGAPNAEQIQALARARCNMAIIESADYWSLTGPSLGRWRDTFAALRAAGIEPVPAIDPFANVAPLLARFPSLAPAQPGIDQLVLSDDSWSALSNRGVVDSPDAPIRVRAGGVYFEAGRDYVVAAPRSGGTSPYWQIRRVADGAIPPGATVDVLYRYTAPGGQTANVLAEDYPEVIRQVVSEIADALDAAFVHIGHGAAPVSGRGEPDLLAASLDAFAKAADGNIRLIADANAFRREGRGRLVDVLPRDAVLEVRTPYGPPPIGPASAQDLAWTRDLDRALLLNAPASPLDALAVCETAARSQDVAGITTADAEVVRMAWSPARSTLPWPRVLNAYFSARLWDPGTVDAFQALVAHANQETVRGVRPETAIENFRRWFEVNRDRIPNDDAAFVEGHYTRILEWVRLENEFYSGDGRNTLRDLIDLVQRHAAAIPEYPENRRSTIVHTIDSTGRFVPSNILFGTPVLPYRAVNLPSGHTVLEVPVRPEFSDQQGAAEALFDVLETPGPILRIDFDTLDPTAISVERSVDGSTFETVQRWDDARIRPPQPPLFIQRPFSATAFRVRVEGNPPILRDPRVFALKDVPAAVCSLATETPELDGRFRERGWPQQAQIAGFVETDQPKFAPVATTVRAMFTRDALYLGVYAREPRMATVVSEMTGRDAPVWNEEAVDIRLDVGNDAYVFAVNPSGTQFDSKNGNAQWNGAWRVYARRFTTGWSAEIEIPFDTLGRRPRSGEDWPCDVVRYRRNVESSVSHWAFRPGETASHAPGRLIFN